jgi:hypothetical protein
LLGLARDGGGCCKHENEGAMRNDSGIHGRPRWFDDTQRSRAALSHPYRSGTQRLCGIDSVAEFGFVQNP